MNTLMKSIVLVLAGSFALVSGSFAQEAATLDELLNLVKKGQASEARENATREKQFLSDKSKQQSRLNAARAERKREQDRSVRLEAQFEKNELLISQKQAQLRERMGSLTELFGHVTSASGDARAIFELSLTGAEIDNDRVAQIDNLIEVTSSGDELPSIEDLEGLWYQLQREMVASGETTTFNTTVVQPDGTESQQDVVRVGVWNVITEDGQYAKYENDQLAVLARQPAGRFTSAAADLAGASSGVHQFGVDPTGPSGGSFLSALIAAPTIQER